MQKIGGNNCEKFCAERLQFAETSSSTCSQYMYLQITETAMRTITRTIFNIV